jgi:hypothetical protein
MEHLIEFGLMDLVYVHDQGLSREMLGGENEIKKPRGG